MKKTLALALCLVLLTAGLTGCSKGDSDVTNDVAADETASFVPDATSLLDSVSGEEDTSTQVEEQGLPDALDQLADVQPDATAEADATNPFGDAASTSDPANPSTTAAVAAYSYTFTELTDTSFGFTFNYPSSWENLPGKHTVCFRQIVEDGQFPARVAITKKTLAHKPKNSDTVLKQFQSYAQVIYAQYDANTFEWSDLNSNATFLGQSAFEITYLAYSGNIEVEGYLVCAAVGSDVYVFHFCSARDEFDALNATMTRMRDSISVVE